MIDEIIEENPWMKNFVHQMSELCFDCSAKIGETHASQCDVARCTSCIGQRLSCGCTDGSSDIWTGLIMPEAHRICLENNLWCRCLISMNGEDFPVDGQSMYNFLLEINLQPEEIRTKHFVLDSPTMKQLYAEMQKTENHNFTARFHIPCERNDIGATADLNRAYDLIYALIYAKEME